MISGISGNSNLYNMIAASGSQSGITGTDQNSQDPMNVFDTVDQDDSNTISEAEFSVLAEAVQQVTGSELNSSFSEYDEDGDGELSAAELKLMMEAAGFKPPPPPPPSAEEVTAAYDAQSLMGNTGLEQTQTDNQNQAQTAQGYGPEVLAQVLDYIENQSGTLDAIA